MIDMHFVKHTFQKMICASSAFISFLKMHQFGYKEVIVCDHIGDFLFTLGYISEFKKEYHIKKVRVSCSKRLHTLAKYYENIESIVAVNGDDIDKIRDFYHYRSGRFFFKRILRAVIIEPAYEYDNLFDSMINDKSMTLRKSICKDVLGLSQESKYVNPFENAAGCEGKKRILICTSATLIDDSQMDVLDGVAEWLISKGFYVEYNESIDGSFLPLDLIVEESNTFKAVVGVRSGLLDLLALCGCNVIAIYPQDYRLIHYFSLKNNDLVQQKVFDYVLSGNSEDDVESILELFRGI